MACCWRHLRFAKLTMINSLYCFVSIEEQNRKQERASLILCPWFSRSKFVESAKLFGLEYDSRLTSHRYLAHQCPREKCAPVDVSWCCWHIWADKRQISTGWVDVCGDSFGCRLPKHAVASNLELFAGRAASDNLWPPPIIRRLAANNSSARRRWHSCCVIIFMQIRVDD